MRVLLFEGDGHVTKSEFVTLWQSITHQNKEHAEAFFYLADLNDDNIIDSSDLNPLYNVFDTDGKIYITRIPPTIFDEYIIISYIHVVILTTSNFAFCVYHS